MKNEFKQSKIDALALEIFNEEKAEGTPVTMEEAQEMARMELGAKEMKRYEKSDAPRKKAVKERKVDADKKYLLGRLYHRLDVETEAHDFKVTNETEFSFWFNGNSYTVKLIKHRAPK